MTYIHAGRGDRYGFRALLHYRELLFFLVWRDLKVRYKQTAIGVIWVVLQPVLMMLIYSMIFGAFLKVSIGGSPYSLFVLAGIVPWTFFANVVSDSGNTLLNNAQLIGKVYFPRILLPFARIMALMVDFGVAICVYFAFAVYFNTKFTLSILYLPLLLLLVILAALGTSTLLSALNVRYRDFQYIIPFTVQVWMFCTPVIYPVNAVPERFRWIIQLNPMTGIVENFRAILLGNPLLSGELLFSAISVVIICVAGVFYFHHAQRTFADII
jgi:lipopolysaccharide transport system permease protein